MADKFRVRIDLDRIQANVLAYEGGRLSELQIRNWLRSVGFTPHGDGTWPDTQDVIEHYWGHIPAKELRMMCSENAAALYRHPLPEKILPEA